MGAHSQAHDHKAKITISCTQDERIYIKNLADKAHMNLSDYILSHLRKDFPKKRKNFPKKIPNKTTQEAMKECEEGRGIKCDSIKDFWKKMGITPSAYS